MFISLTRMFFGAQKFRDFIHECDPLTHGDVIICFDPNETFHVQFQQVAIKVLAAITFTEEGKEEIASHRELLQMCHGAQPFVCLRPGYALINKNKRLQALILQQPVKSMSGFSYSPCSPYYNLNDKTIDTILQSKVSNDDLQAINKQN
mgnify:FL=1